METHETFMLFTHPTIEESMYSESSKSFCLEQVEVEPKLKADLGGGSGTCSHLQNKKVLLCEHKKHTTAVYQVLSVLLCLIQTWWGAGGTPSQIQVGTQSQVWGVYPVPCQGVGYPVPGLGGGVLHPRSGGYPIPELGWGTPPNCELSENITFHHPLDAHGW